MRPSGRQTWRLGEPRDETSDAADLKNRILADLRPSIEPIILPFKLEKVDGVIVDAAEGIAFPGRLRPGKSIELVFEWDGLTRLERNHPAAGGLPADGPASVAVSVSYTRPTGDRSRSPKTREVTAALETSVIEGRDDELLHPLEVIDIALEEPVFLDLIEASVPGSRSDTGALRSSTRSPTRPQG